MSDQPKRPVRRANPGIASAEPPTPSPGPPGRHRTAEGVETPLPLPEGFSARDGDSLVISYPEVTLPLPRKFAMMKFGGLIYTRKLNEGEDVAEQYEVISKWLFAVGERDGVAKYRKLLKEFIK